MIAAYAAAVFAAPWLIEATSAKGALLVVLAALPAAPIAGVFLVIGRYIAAADEYVRARHVKAMLLGGALLLSGLTAWDFLRVYAGAPPPGPFVAGPGFFALFGIAQGLIIGFEALTGRRAL
jgi:hypothetical protein